MTCRSGTADSTWCIRTARVFAMSLALVAGCRGATDSLPPSQWTVLGASEAYTCGLSSHGEAFCWGGVAGYYDPTPLTDSLIPVSALPLLVPGGYRFTEITVGALSMCGLDSDERAFCWGANQYGEAGDSSYLAKRAPSAIAGNHRWRMTSSGGVHACGVTIDDETYCWGNQFRGALGNGQLNGSTPYPVAVLGGLTFRSVYAGLGTSCALTPNGDAYCWGINDYGMLGDSQPPEPLKESATPSRVVGQHRFESLAIGDYNVCGITQDRRAYCWGYGGVLGNGNSAPSSVPVPVHGDMSWSSLSVGSGHTCGLTAYGAVYCWGNNERGQFGIGDTGRSMSPVLVARPGKFVSITAGGNHTCGLTAAGIAFCWGQGDYGQLGDGIMRDRFRPTKVGSYK